MNKLSFGNIKTTSHVVPRVQPKYLSPTGQIINAGNLKEVKGRIKAVVSIRKITKTMNMIATSRLKQAQNRMERSRVFYQTVSGLLDRLPPLSESKTNQILLLPIGSDKGLCGGINTSITKFVKNIIKKNEKDNKKITVSVVGEKIPPQLSKEHGEKIIWTVGEISKKPVSWMSVSAITERLLKNQFDKVFIVYNHFNSVISYTTTSKEIPSQLSYTSENPFFDEYEFEDDEGLHHLVDLFEHLFATSIYHSIGDGTASELGGRMSSMDNATRNAGEMIKRLTIMFNRKRQAAITTELTEIISGASAIQK
jgi:F-type H+-transporting ATPase subunit gamma